MWRGSPHSFLTVVSKDAGKGINGPTVEAVGKANSTLVGLEDV